MTKPPTGPPANTVTHPHADSPPQQEDGRDKAPADQFEDSLRLQRDNRDLKKQMAVRGKTMHLSESRLRAILDAAADAIVTIDRRGIIVDVNPATLRMFGFDEEELVGQNVSLLMPSPYSEEHDGYIARYLATKERRIIGSRRDLTGRRKNGTLFPISLSVGEINSLSMFSGIICDRSDREALQKQVLEAAANEDRRIGQELHDNIQQQCAGLGLLAECLAKSLRQSSAAEADMAERLASGIQEAGRQVSLLARGLVPVDVDAEGLHVALLNLTERITAQYGLECVLCFQTPIEVADNFVATHLYRITQEAITNATKHGQARRIEVHLSQADGRIELEVLDNGTGIAPQRGGSKGRGLQIMGYRANLLGGTLQFGRREEGGTFVRCTIVSAGTTPAS